jgi:hypothetical protein
VGVEKRQGGKKGQMKRNTVQREEKQRGGKGENRRVGITSKRCFEWEEGD